MAKDPAQLLARLNELSTEADEQFVGDYKVKRTLGKGSCGIVKLCEHRRTGEEVAVKIVSRGELDKSPAQRRRTDAEIRALNSVSHHSICRLHEVIETREHKYIVMEYLRGGELYDFILKNGRLSPEQTFFFFASAYSAVLHLHKRGTYHRDIKPENLLMDRSGRLKLCDFGFALSGVGAAELVVTECGSPHYSSPEIVSRQQHQPVVSEVWSLGVLLFVLATSTLPFDAPTQDVLLRRITSQSYSIPEDVPRRLADLIRKMLHGSGKERIAIADISKHDWFEERFPRLPLELKQSIEQDAKAAWEK